MDTSGNVKLEILPNKQLGELSKAKRSNGDLVWRKKDIVAELIAKAYQKKGLIGAKCLPV